jgi:hypothetical protein
MTLRVLRGYHVLSWLHCIQASLQHGVCSSLHAVVFQLLLQLLLLLVTVASVLCMYHNQTPVTPALLAAAATKAPLLLVLAHLHYHRADMFQCELFLAALQQLLQLLPAAGSLNLLLQHLAHCGMTSPLRPT